MHSLSLVNVFAAPELLWPSISVPMVHLKNDSYYKFLWIVADFQYCKNNTRTLELFVVYTAVEVVFATDHTQVRILCLCPVAVCLRLPCKRQSKRGCWPNMYPTSTTFLQKGS
jgi:hypothetical protein